MDLNIPEVKHPGWWALEISHAMGTSEYINPPGGEDLFDRAAFEERGITLTITKIPDFTYACYPYEFIEHLSIIDVMLWCSPEEVKTYLDQFAGTK
jgi:hypothetical protein